MDWGCKPPPPSPANSPEPKIVDTTQQQGNNVSADGEQSGNSNVESDIARFTAVIDRLSRLVNPAGSSQIPSSTYQGLPPPPLLALTSQRKRHLSDHQEVPAKIFSPPCFSTTSQHDDADARAWQLQSQNAVKRSSLSAASTSGVQSETLTSPNSPELDRVCSICGAWFSNDAGVMAHKCSHIHPVKTVASQDRSPSKNQQSPLLKDSPFKRTHKSHKSIPQFKDAVSPSMRKSLIASVEECAGGYQPPTLIKPFGSGATGAATSPAGNVDVEAVAPSDHDVPSADMSGGLQAPTRYSMGIAKAWVIPLPQKVVPLQPNLSLDIASAPTLNVGLPMPPDFVPSQPNWSFDVASTSTLDFGPPSVSDYVFSAAGGGSNSGESLIEVDKPSNTDSDMDVDKTSSDVDMEMPPSIAEDDEMET